MARRELGRTFVRCHLRPKVAATSIGICRARAMADRSERDGRSVIAVRRGAPAIIRRGERMSEIDEGRAPTAGRLLDVRTPAELAFSPDGSRVAFALHSTVADVGSFQPSDLYLIEGDGEPTALTSGAWSDRTPVWSPDGSRLAFLSDRITPGHQLPYTMVPGEEPVHVGTFVGSAESVAWSSDGDASAGPGGRSRVLRVGLERASGERRRAGAGPRDPAPGRSAPPPVHARPGVRRQRGGRASRHGHLGGRLGRRWTGRRDRIRRPTGRIRLVRGQRRPAGPRRAHRAHAVRADLADRVVVALAGWDPRRGDRGLCERPRAPERQREDGQPG